MSRKFKAEADRIVRAALDGNIGGANDGLREAIDAAGRPRRRHLNYRTVAVGVALMLAVCVGIDLLDGHLVDL